MRYLSSVLFSSSGADLDLAEKTTEILETLALPTCYDELAPSVDLLSASAATLKERNEKEELEIEPLIEQMEALVERLKGRKINNKEEL